MVFLPCGIIPRGLGPRRSTCTLRPSSRVDQRLQRQGLLRVEPAQRVTINSLTGKKDADGSVAVQFGGCDGKIPNCIPIMKGWNYMVRLYRPHAEILNGKWKFPEAQPAS